MTPLTIEGFRYETLPGADGVPINVATAGSGPAVVLLHGFPQTHYMWRDVARDLARDHTVVALDLRGYGESGKPAEAGQGTYSKRTMGDDVVQVAAALGHDQFGLVGHDRGALVGVRAGLDHPEAVAYLGILDVLPTLDTWGVLHGVDAKVAWHLYLMAQPVGLPEKMIAAVADEFFGSFLDAWDTDGTTFTPEVRRHYVDSSVAAVDSIVADYRATAGIDLSAARVRRLGAVAGVGAGPDLRAHRRRALHGRGEAGRRRPVRARPGGAPRGASDALTLLRGLTGRSEVGLGPRLHRGPSPRG
jgi:pimeloyl-ACP methyl ester carboxylesterase